MSAHSPHSANRSLRIIGAVVCTVGWLLAAGASLCTLAFHGALSSGGSDLGLVLLFGGVPMLVGGFLAWSGYTLWRRNAPSNVRDDRNT